MRLLILKLKFMFKKVLSTVLIVVLVGFAQTLLSQTSVKEAIELAEKLSKKVKKNNLEDFQVVYPKAITEIEKTIADASTSEFGYDAVVENAGDWIALNNILSTVPDKKFVFKDESFEFSVTDYKPLLAEAKLKASDAYFNAGVNQLDKSGTYDEKCTAIKTLILANDYSDNHKDEILNLRAKVYYDEAIVLSSSNDLTDLKKSVNLFYESNKMVDNYADNKAKREELSPKVAEAVYQQAEAEAKIESFEAQKKAAELYLEASKWVKNYKDCKEKEEMVTSRSEINIFIIDKLGNPVSPTRMEYALQSKLNKGFYTPVDFAAFTGLNMNETKNYQTAVSNYGKGMIIMKIDNSAVEYNYVNNPPKTTTETVNAYTIKKKDETTESSIDESTYKASKKLIDFGINNNADPGDRVFEYTGTLTRTVESAELIVKYPLEIWDLRDPAKPVKIHTEYVSESYSDKKTVENFEGNANAKPKTLIKDEKTVATKEQLVTKATAGNVDITKIVKNDLDTYATELNKIQYRHPITK